jgi:hypothetical protein
MDHQKLTHGLVFSTAESPAIDHMTVESTIARRHATLKTKRCRIVREVQTSSHTVRVAVLRWRRSLRRLAHLARTRYRHATTYAQSSCPVGTPAKGSAMVESAVPVWKWSNWLVVAADRAPKCSAPRRAIILQHATESVTPLSTVGVTNAANCAALESVKQQTGWQTRKRSGP